MDNMELFREALERGNKVRKLQDEVLAIFVYQLRKIGDRETLETIKKELAGNG
ncbi:hypothetical protein [Cytobacillus firmus]|uniref:hypothetical protein n=1 Tax=Cytobacillus firmus TaxID=1399 RepID=UPI0018CF2F3A|nr:hypothetical protein [Cytobacillus firmus]